MRWLQFILSHSIFIAICAVALACQSYVLLNVTPNLLILGIIFFSTLCSYNFYWLISKYAFSRKALGPEFLEQNISYILLFVVAGTGLLACLFASMHVLWYLLPGVLLTLLYSLPLWPFFPSESLRKAGFLKTTLLAFTWAYVTVVLPLADACLPWSAMGILLLSRFFFMLLLCAIFDKRDAKVDKINALHSLATDIKDTTFRTLMIIFFACYLFSGILLRLQLQDASQLIALFITAAAVGVVYHLSFRQQGYLFYYFVVDGLMLFAGMLSIIASAKIFH